jgi:hypothetical protein
MRDIEALAKEIDKTLREQHINKVRKRDIVGRWNLTSNNKVAVSIYYWLVRMGWVETWSHLERAENHTTV